MWWRWQSRSWVSITCAKTELKHTSRENLFWSTETDENPWSRKMVCTSSRRRSFTKSRSQSSHAYEQEIHKIMRTSGRFTIFKKLQCGLDENLLVLKMRPGSGNLFIISSLVKRWWFCRWTYWMCSVTRERVNHLKCDTVPLSLVFVESSTPLRHFWRKLLEAPVSWLELRLKCCHFCSKVQTDFNLFPFFVQAMSLNIDMNIVLPSKSLWISPVQIRLNMLLVVLKQYQFWFIIESSRVNRTLLADSELRRYSMILYFWNFMSFQVAVSFSIHLWIVGRHRIVFDVFLFSAHNSWSNRQSASTYSKCNNIQKAHTWSRDGDLRPILHGSCENEGDWEGRSVHKHSRSTYSRPAERGRQIDRYWPEHHWTKNYRNARTTYIYVTTVSWEHCVTSKDRYITIVSTVAVTCGIRWTQEIFFVSSQEHTVPCTRWADATTRERENRHLMCRTTLAQCTLCWATTAAQFTLCRPKTHTCRLSWKGYTKAKLKKSRVATRQLFAENIFIGINLCTKLQYYTEFRLSPAISTQLNFASDTSALVMMQQRFLLCMFVFQNSCQCIRPF